MKTRKFCEDVLATRAIMYSDTINGVEVHRDDLWAVTTTELNAVHLLREDFERLLEANRELLAVLKRFIAGDGHWTNDVWDQARAAIAKHGEGK